MATIAVKVVYSRGAAKASPVTVDLAEGATAEDLQEALCARKWRWTADEDPTPSCYTVKSADAGALAMNAALQNGEVYLVTVGKKRAKAAGDEAAAPAKKPRARDGADWMQEHVPIRSDEELKEAQKAASRFASTASYARKTNNEAKAKENTESYALVQQKIKTYVLANPQALAGKYRSEVEDVKSKVVRDGNKFLNMVCRTLDQSAEAVRLFSEAGLTPATAPALTDASSGESAAPRPAIDPQLIVQLLQTVVQRQGE